MSATSNLHDVEQPVGERLRTRHFTARWRWRLQRRSCRSRCWTVNSQAMCPSCSSLPAARTKGRDACDSASTPFPATIIRLGRWMTAGTCCGLFFVFKPQPAQPLL